MTRYIWCPECARRPSPKYEGEISRKTPGLALQLCHCDSCNSEIQPGEKATAVSIWRDGDPHGQWEHNYLRFA
jgi:hypothetical protein